MPTLLSMTRVLFAVSGSDYWTLADGTRHPCGYWPEELAVPHEVFAQAGFDITIATPGAVPPTADEAGFSAAMNGGSEEPGQRFRAYLDSISGPLSAPTALEDADPADYDLVFVPSRAPWLLEDRLSSSGGSFEASGAPWAAHVVVDGNLYTGQNPASSLPLATALVQALS